MACRNLHNFAFYILKNDCPLWWKVYEVLEVKLQMWRLSSKLYWIKQFSLTFFVFYSLTFSDNLGLYMTMSVGWKFTPLHNVYIRKEYLYFSRRAVFCVCYRAGSEDTEWEGRRQAAEPDLQVPGLQRAWQPARTQDQAPVPLLPGQDGAGHKGPQLWPRGTQVFR